MATVGLLGTKYVMEGEFYIAKLREAGLRVIIPDEPDRTYVHNAIYDEFTQDRFLPETKAALLKIVDRLQAGGAEGVLLSCTELPMVLKSGDSALPFFDTTKIHVEATVSRMFA
jgi:aspartate racemase